MIDVNITWGRCPFRRLPLEGESLLKRLKDLGISEACAGSFDALLFEDTADVNARLAADCASGTLKVHPFGTVNPMLPDWLEDVRRCRDVHKMKGIRLHPEFHGYAPTEPAFRDLLAAAARAGLLVQICWRFEDERTVLPVLKLKDWGGPEALALSDLVPKIEGLRLMILNGQTDLRGAPLVKLAKSGDVTFDIARQEASGGVARLVEAIGVDKVLFGAHAPFFAPESSVLKLKESGLDAAALEKITNTGASRLLGA